MCKFLRIDRLQYVFGWLGAHSNKYWVDIENLFML